MFMIMPHTQSATTSLHPMRIVVQRTGLTPDLLRAWEKRYGVLSPVRSAGGQRYYTDADVDHLLLLTRAIEGGRQIGQIARLPLSELQAMVEQDEIAARSTPLRMSTVATDNGDSVLAAALAAVDRFDGPSLETTLRGAAVRLSIDEMLDDVVGPLLFTIGSLWHEGLLRPANEHLATSIIRRTLSWMTDQASLSAGAPAIVIATPAGQSHEMGAMLASAAAASNGWRVVYLGSDLQASEIANAVHRTRATTVALSIVYPIDDEQLIEELRELRAALPPSVAMIVGGSGAGAYAPVLREVGAEVVTSLGALRNRLRATPGAR
jgi:DNA-binding transcriptional MerR regulator/methylmalonyl-CoA mutase cobalamin-binding subunit